MVVDGSGRSKTRTRWNCVRGAVDFELDEPVVDSVRLCDTLLDGFDDAGDESFGES